MFECGCVGMFLLLVGLCCLCLVGWVWFAYLDMLLVGVWVFDCLRLFNDCSGYLLLACLFGGWVFLVDLYGCYPFWVVWLLVLGLGVILLWVV